MLSKVGCLIGRDCHSLSVFMREKGLRRAGEKAENEGAKRA